MDVAGTRFRGRPQNIETNKFVLTSRIKELSVDYVADSEYEDEDKLNAGESSNDDEPNTRKKKTQKDLEFNIDRERYNPRFEISMRFNSFSEFKEAVKNWGIKNRWQLHFPTNDKLRCNAMCYLEKKNKKEVQLLHLDLQNQYK